MIYFISKLKEDEILGFQYIKNKCIVVDNFELLFDFIDNNTLYGYDSETIGDFIDGRILMSQYGNYETQFVIDHESFSYDETSKSVLSEARKKILHNPKNTRIIHNGQYDLKFDYYSGIDIINYNIIDTMLIQMILKKGYKTVEKQASLKSCCQNYLNVDIDKTERGNIHKGITASVIEYAANDVKYLIDLYKKQWELVKHYELELDCEGEFEFLKTLVLIICKGFYLNWDKWLTRYQNLLNRHSEIHEKLQNIICTDKRFQKYVEKQLDLFLPQKSNLNFNSPVQMLQFFQELGVNTKTYNKQKSKESDTVDIKVLQKQKEIHPIIPIYIEYKELEKDISTYGKNWDKYIHKTTNRIHTQYTQILNTGRISSGGEMGGADYVNLQNIPNDKETRSCFTSQEEDFDIISLDYSSQEPRITADKCKDKNLIDFILNSDGDLHNYVGTKISKYILGEEIQVSKENNPKTNIGKGIRDIAKTINLGLDYGKTAFTTKDDLGCSQKEAQKLIDLVKNSFPEKEVYFLENFKKTLRQGYILFNDVDKSKCFIPELEQLKELYFKGNCSISSNGELKINNYENLDKNELSLLYKLYNGLKRDSQNYPTQGTASKMTKLASVLITKELIKRNYLTPYKSEKKDLAFIVNLVHDEIVIESHNSISKEIGDIASELMIKAGNHYCKIIPMKVEPEIKKYWSK